MIIAYDPLTDVLSVSLQVAPALQTLQQGTIAVSLDVNGEAVSVSIPGASTLLWENGGQVSVMLPAAAPVATVVETTTVTERFV